MSPTDARVTHPVGFGPISAGDAKASRHEVTMSGPTILHNPPPAGPKELTDLISCLNNCRAVWHVADLDVCECECVFFFTGGGVYVTEGVTVGTDGQWLG